MGKGGRPAARAAAASPDPPKDRLNELISLRQRGMT
jgi:hypothetical protein